jgi:MFS family permease
MSTDNSARHAPTSDRGPAPAPQSFAALRHPDARVYLGSTMLAMMADNIEHVITYWMLYQKFHSPALGGFAVISHWLPFLLFSMWSGGLADRRDPRRVIQFGMVLFMSVSFCWGLLFVTGSLQMWHAAVLLTVHGFAGVFWGPASQLLVHEIVGRTQLQSAIRLMATSRTLGMLLGPAVGGVILLGLGAAPGIFLNVLIYLPLTLWLWKAPYGPRFRAGGRPQPRALRGFADIAATIRLIAADRTILTMTLLAGGASLFIGNAHQAQMPEFAHDLGSASAGLYYSLLLAANAAGALVAGIVLESRGLLVARPRTAFILALGWCLAIAGFAAAASYPLALAMLFVSGFLNLAFNSMAQTLVQLQAPVEIRGRVIGVYNMSAQGMKTFSGFTVGVAGGMIGIHWSLGLSAALLFAVIGGLFAFALRTQPATAAGE